MSEREAYAAAAQLLRNLLGKIAARELAAPRSIVARLEGAAMAFDAAAQALLDANEPDKNV